MTVQVSYRVPSHHLTLTSGCNLRHQPTPTTLTTPMSVYDVIKTNNPTSSSAFYYPSPFAILRRLPYLPIPHPPPPIAIYILSLSIKQTSCPPSKFILLLHLATTLVSTATVMDTDLISSSPQEISPSLPMTNPEFTQALPAQPYLPSTNPRRLPPPCWSNDETVALIDAYCEKWYTLRRGNLKANHWVEVAEAVTRRCPMVSPPKTAIQCRHKMEKLRKRYRTEIQKARSMPVSRFTSTWVHFKRMNDMEKGPSAKSDHNSGSEDDDSDYDDDNNISNNKQNLYQNGLLNKTLSREKFRPNHYMAADTSGGSSGGAGNGFRIRIPNGVSIAQPGPSKFYSNTNHNLNNYTNPNPSSIPNLKSGIRMRGYVEFDDKREPDKEEREPVDEMVQAIKMLGDGFVRMEHMKMDAAREMERMRIDMEIKRTEMILESQQRIVEAFANVMSDNNKRKAKRMRLTEF